MENGRDSRSIGAHLGLNLMGERAPHPGSEVEKAYFLINCGHGDQDGVYSAIKALDGVKEATMTDGPYDMVVKVESADMVDMKINKIRNIHGIKSILTLQYEMKK